MLRVIEPGDRQDYGTRTLSESTGIVVIEGDAPDEVTSTEARKMASRRAATLGLSRPGLGIASGSYLVDANGEETNTSSGTSKYRCDYPIQGGM